MIPPSPPTHPEFIYLWAKLCRRYMANFESSYSWLAVEVDLNIV
jgi:hypothetical protein